MNVHRGTDRNVCPTESNGRHQTQLPGRSRRSGRGPEVFLCALFMVWLAGPAMAGQSAKPVPGSTSNPTQPSSPKKKKKTAAARRPAAPEPQRIREIQGALAKEGYYLGEPTGKWDDASVEAMKEFQSAHGLPATGKLEALSLQRLGLGSPVAGVAAPDPRPPAGSTAAAPEKPPR